jgi:hypothetical protein
MNAAPRTNPIIRSSWYTKDHRERTAKNPYGAFQG